MFGFKRKLRRKTYCQKHGHSWGDGQFRQDCTRGGCKAYRILIENRFPEIGEAKYEWEVVDMSLWTELK